MKNPKKFLELAAKISRWHADRASTKSFHLAAVATRDDGAFVFAYNGSTDTRIDKAHAENRLTRKLDQGATVYVARTLADGSWGCSKPCPNCRRVLRRAKVKRVFYTIGPNEWGCLDFKNLSE